MSYLDLPSFQSEVIPKGCKLLPGVQQIYELELALGELRSLEQSELITRSAYFHLVNGKETHHYNLCAGLPLLAGEHPSVRLRAFFETYQFKTGYATHGLFPYRGKFHPQLIKALMNIMKLRGEDVVLDPMTGSGTTNIEASTIGLKSIGVDANPFCLFMTQTKADALKLGMHDLEYVKDLNEVFEYYSSPKKLQLTLDQNVFRRSPKPGFARSPILENLFLLCYLDAMAYAKRRKNKTPKDVFPVVFQRYLNVVKKFIVAREKLGLRLGEVIVAKGDARDLRKLESKKLKSINEEEIDGIITSPPYYFAIDYLEEDRSQLEYLGYDIDELRERMIGLRGAGLKQKIDYYFEDMNAVFGEMSRVLRNKKYCIIIIGYNTLQIQRTLEDLGVKFKENLIQIAKTRNLNLERHIIRPIEGARNIMQTEDILIFQKKG